MSTKLRWLLLLLLVLCDCNALTLHTTENYNLIHGNCKFLHYSTAVFRFPGFQIPPGEQSSDGYQSTFLVIIREVNPDMPIYINRTNAGKNQMPHLIFSSICSVYIDKHIRVDLSDDEQYVRNMPCYIICMGLLIHLVR